jgi:IS5 family transposase
VVLRLPSAAVLTQLLNTENLLEPLLEQINAHLEQNSIIVALGSIYIIDATVIEAKQSRKRKGKDDNNTQDPEASYNVNFPAFCYFYHFTTHWTQ